MITCFELLFRIGFTYPKHDISKVFFKIIVSNHRQLFVGTFDKDCPFNLNFPKHTQKIKIIGIMSHEYNQLLRKCCLTFTFTYLKSMKNVVIPRPL